MGWRSRTVVPKGWLAVRVWPDRICVAQVATMSGEKPCVTLCRMRNIEGAGGAAGILKSLAREISASRHQVLCLLNTGEYQFLLVEAPNVPANELRSAVRWRIKDQLDYLVDAATLDVLPVPSDRSTPTRAANLYVVTAQNTLIAERQLLLEDARFPLSVIDIPELAQRNLAALLEEPERGLALLSFDASGGLLTFTCNGELYLARRTDVSLQQILTKNPDQQTRMFDRLALDVQRTIDHFDRQFRSIALSRLVLSLLPPECGLEAHLVNNLSLPVMTASMDVFFDLSGVVELPELSTVEQQAECLLTLGAALRAAG
ncbi:MSHA biogenesis protein MshI [Gammaproteobacteria bacterium]